MKEPLVLSLATERNQYVNEFEKSLRRLGYEYEILGLNHKWEGFKTKMKFYFDKLSQLKDDDIVIVCDSYDIVFLEKPGLCMKRYNELTKGRKNQVIIGLEDLIDIHCYFSKTCDYNFLNECKKRNSIFPGYDYINSGFIMGPVYLVKDIFRFQLKNNETDDQVGLMKWVKNRNCKNCIFDYKLEFVLNYLPNFVKKNKDKIELKDKSIFVTNRKSNITTNPIALHFPNQKGDFGERTEYLRNRLFPERNKVPKIEYFKACYNSACSQDNVYIGIWLPVILILFLIFIPIIYTCS